MYNKIKTKILGRDAFVFEGLCNFSLSDTFECGQAFRFVKLSPSDSGEENGIGALYPGYVEYMTTAYGKLLFVGQRSRDELIVFTDEEEMSRFAERYFALDVDYGEIKRDIKSKTDSEFLNNAADVAQGIRILRQEPWEALFSFIVSQNNNIPRIKKIIRALAVAYGDNLADCEGLSECPLEALENRKCGAKLNTDACIKCGICYSFPKPDAVSKAPELMQPSHPGFRYKYLLDAAEKVASGEIDLEKITKAASYEYTLSELMKIKGVGEKVASCTALFAFSNLDAFPIDVWMRRAIDEYFGGELDPKTLGKYAGVAQQYIFHYSRLHPEKFA